jgi:2',3'-cyclic-nucleotide 2'-phosphodiesterase
MSKPLKVLFIADIVGEPGLNLLETILPGIIDKYQADFIVANAENSHEGRGINQQIVKSLYQLGIHVITGGNHSFDKWKIFPYMKEDHHLLRPLNYPRGNPGFGYCVRGVPGSDHKIGVLNLQGRTFMPSIDDPFSTAEWAIENIKKETNLILVDFHAEATAEKMALAMELDSKVSLFIGTHTHVPTNDARILPGGTGYITDAGMTGPFNSVIGMDIRTSILRFTRGTPQKYKLGNGDNRMCAVYAELDTESAKCTRIEPVLYPGFQFSNK